MAVWRLLLLQGKWCRIEEDKTQGIAVQMESPVGTTINMNGGIRGNMCSVYRDGAVKRFRGCKREREGEREREREREKGRERERERDYTRQLENM